MMRAVIALVVAAGPAWAAPLVYTLPEETAVFAPGPGVEVVQQNCSGCHSADYVSTQPRPLADPVAFWTAEVGKMRKVYGAPIEEKDVAAIVGYLAGTYGK